VTHRDDRGVVMPPLSPALTALWHLLFDLSDQIRRDWCLIGGQMVTLHGLEHARTDIRPSIDGDLLVDIRADPTALRRVVGFFTGRAFAPDPGPDGLLHRFNCRLDAGVIVVDILVPDNLGPRADLTTSPPGRTLSVPGGTQALNRVERVRVTVAGRSGEIPRPNLLAAILGKEAALRLPGDPGPHLYDLAFLLSLLPDPVLTRRGLTATERRKLRACVLIDRGHPAWNALPAARANAGHAALRLLGSQPQGQGGR
jgi:hypothetical protein